MTAGRPLRRTFAACVVSLLAACAEPPVVPEADAPGDPLPELDEARLGRFLLGQAVFERLATPEEGLGPLYNADRCSGCHDQPSSGGSGDLRVVKATRWDDAQGRCDLLVPAGGDNIQQLATPLLQAAGISAESVPAEANALASVVAPTLYGLGLVEAIPWTTLERLADPDDRDGDGISGRVGIDPNGARGRFGRKGEVATIADFTDTALRFELGFTTPTHPFEEAVNGVPLPSGVDPIGEPEIDARGVELLIDYMRYLAPPPREVTTGAAADSVAAGDALFTDVGCADCHTPVLETGPNADAALADLSVALYSDLLLHDLGPDLAGSCGPGAAPSEHRTSRLWGLRFRSTYLHDGRAPSLEDAIRAHGGEGASSRAAFEALSDTDRAHLIRFLRSL